MNYIYSFLFLCLSIFSVAQQIHIKYKYVRSPIAVLTEDVYCNGKDVIAVQDSLIDIDYNGKRSVLKSPMKMFYSSKMNKDTEKPFFGIQTLNKSFIFAHDDVPMVDWKIDDKSKKKIAGYECIKATGNYRGYNITAYFSPEIKYPIGPYKFYGLSGAILELRYDGLSHYIWVADKVELDNKEKVKYYPNPNIERMTMREYVRRFEEEQGKMSIDMLKKLPTGTKSQTTNNRLGLEKKYEWEK